MLLGIDIGGTKIAVALANEAGEIVGKLRRATDPSGSGEDDVERIADDARRLISEAGGQGVSLSAIGVSVPGPLDPAREHLIHPPNLPGWHEVPVRQLLAKSFDAPVALENDANAAALAEWRFGAGRGCRDLVYLTMSTGVGAGLILDGRLYRGTTGNAGEIGHTKVEWDGEPCACGGRGCLEAYVGGAAWAVRLRREAPEDSRVVALAGNRDEVTPEHVVRAAAAGDAYALAEFDRYNRYLARAISNVVFALAPEIVVLGTIASAAGEGLCLAPVRAQVAEQVWPSLGERLQIVPSALGAQLADVAGVCVASEARRNAAG